jgi:hypothetical protein
MHAAIVTWLQHAKGLQHLCAHVRLLGPSVLAPELAKRGSAKAQQLYCQWEGQGSLGHGGQVGR